MTDRPKLRQHTALLHRMAAALGVDLEDAALNRDVDMSQIADAVLRCTECSNPAHCSLWLDDHPDGAADTPGYCRNRALIRDLRDRIAQRRGQRDERD